ncbi:putative phage abortive infection protein [Leptospira sp. 85282-16]|uniref:putative phage abortive infection protein n=1 Tax=Leptospira sp. 85282-16 TaxID=2971256 RepID=UPI0021BEC9CE|nr:putative phage abortive infection protein [Leptospira sp. 85282-16]MCT8332552.1 putative phage abortive infection protein [Leptospira sp. 85282-16]
MRYEKNQIGENMKTTISISIFVFLFGFALIHFPLVIEPLNHYSIYLNLDKASKLGSFLSGYAGSIFLLFNILLLLYIHFEQSKADFEKQFYTFIEIHRSNVERIKHSGFNGVEAIEKIIDLYDNILHGFVQNGWQNIPFEQKINDAYFVIYYGYNTRAFKIISKNFKSNTSDYFSFMSNVIYHTEGVEKNVINGNTVIPGLDKYLSTYFRHLFQFVRFIDENEIISKKKKLIFARILRAQLTTHEQALLLVNSLGTIGKEWTKRNFIIRYQLVKNIPRGFFKSFDHEKFVEGIKWEHDEYSHSA